MTEKNLILSKSRENIIPRVVNIAIKEDTNNRPFKITSTSSLALLLFLIFLMNKLLKQLLFQKSILL